MKKTSFWLGCLLVVGAGQARADLIHLKTGMEFRGRIIEEGDREILLEVPNGRATILQRDVARIERESDYVYYLLQGETLLERGSYSTAAAQFQEAIRLQPESREAVKGFASSRKGEGDLLLQRRHLEEAKKAYEDALEADPDLVEARARRKHVQAVIGEAKRLEREAARLRGEGSFAEAARALQQSLDFDPSRWSEVAPELGDLQRRAGDQLFREARYAGAAAAYDLALRADPDLAAAVQETRVYSHMRMVRALLEADDVDGARPIVSGLRYIAPYHPRVLYAWGRIEHLQGHLKAARDAYLRVLGESKPPEDPTDLRAMESRAREALGPPPEPGKRARAAVDGAEPWSLLEIGPIRIRHKQPELARDVAVAVGYYLDVLPAHVSPLPRPNPIYFEIWIHPDRDSHRTEGGRGTSSLLLGPARGAATNSVIHLDASAPQALTCNLPREIGRLLHLAYQSYHRMHPPWVEEGTAGRCEPVFKRLHYVDRVADGFRRGETKPLRRLLGGAEAAGEVDRAWSYALVEFLVKQRGLRHFTEAVDDLSHLSLKEFLARRYGMETLLGMDPLEGLSNDLRDWVQARSILLEKEE